MVRYFLFLSFLLSYSLSLSCSMVSFTDATGRVWVGNNEDYYDPDTWMWTLQKGKHAYGAVYFGYGNLFAQGGMNEAGLVFDGFAMEAKPLQETSGKKKIDPSKLVNKIMHSCATVQEVKEVLEAYQLGFLENGQLMFVDKTGASLIAEGDAILIKPANEYRLCTNFYQSDISSHQDITCERYLSGYQVMETTPMANRGKELCIDALKAMHQRGFWGGTQYSNVYDPQQGTFYLYFFQDFEDELALTLADVLKTVKKPKQISELFEPRSDYIAFREAYQQTDQHSQAVLDAKTMEELIPSLQALKALELSRIFANRLFPAMDAQLNEQQWDMVLETGLLCKELFPQSWKVNAVLAKAYFEKDMIEEALRHIEQAIVLNPNEDTLKAAKKKIGASSRQ